MKSLQKYIYVCLLSIFQLVNNVYGQEFNVTYYTAKDGLALGFQGYIEQDYKGQIWTSSPGGLSRFDGQDFKIFTYDRFDKREMNIEEHSPIYESRDSLLWIGTTEGLYKYDQLKDEFHLYQVDIPYRSDTIIPEITCIAEDDMGLLWLGSYGGLYSFDKTYSKWTYYETRPQISYQHQHQSVKRVSVIQHDKYDDNILWMGGNSRLYKFDVRKKQFVKTIELPSAFDFGINVHAIEQISKDLFYLGFYGEGLKLYDVSKDQLSDIEISSKIMIAKRPFKIVKDILSLDSFRILCTNYSGPLFIYNRKLKNITYLNEYDIDKRGHQLYRDNDGAIWVTSKEGLTKLQNKHAHTYSLSHELGDANLYGTAFDVKNNCYLTHTTNGEWCFECYNESNKTEYEYIPIHSDLEYNDIVYDQYLGRFLLIGKQQLYTISTKEQSFKHYMNHRGKGYRRLLVTEDLLYLSKQRNLDIYNRKGELISSLYLPDSLFHGTYQINQSRYLLENNQLYFKTNNQIIECNKNDKTHRTILYNPDIIIYDFKIVNRKLYLATNNGLFQYIADADGIYVINNDFKDPSNAMNLRHITQVKNVLYMSNGPGVFGYDIESDKRVMELGEEESLGYLGKLVYNDNKLYTISVSNFFEIELGYTPQKIYDLRLTDLVIPNVSKEDLIGEDLVLHSNQNGMSVSWNCCYYGDHTQIEYSYKLTGVNEEWVNNGNSTRVNFSNLARGEYNLFIKADAIGHTIERSILKFEILSPWWMTWWFIMAAIVFVAMVSYYGYQWRVNQLRSENRHQQEVVELELKALRAQMNPHFIFNSLNSIKRLIQRNDNENAIDYLTNFSMMIRQILSNSDKKIICLEDEVDFCKRYLEIEKLRFKDKFEYIIDIDNQIDMNGVFVPPLFLQPYLENALWHGIMNSGRPGRLILRVEQKEESIQIVIDDNGVGREQSLKTNSLSPLKKKSRGIELSRKRSELSELLFDQKIDIDIIDKYTDDIASGTKVVINIYNLPTG